MPSNHATSARAGGNILPCRAVKISNSAGAEYTVLQAGANEDAFGISQEGTHDAPGLAGSDNYAATSGEQLVVYIDGEECLWETGEDTITQGSYLIPDSLGRAVVASNSGTTIQNVLARALQGATGAGKKIRVLVQPMKIRPALA